LALVFYADIFVFVVVLVLVLFSFMFYLQFCKHFRFSFDMYVNVV